MYATNLAAAEARRTVREEVHHRTRGVDALGRQLQLVVVNISPGGLMARCETPLAEGARLRITLPSMGQLVAEVRWSLGGRFGCQFERAIALTPYTSLLASLSR